MTVDQRAEPGTTFGIHPGWLAAIYSCPAGHVWSTGWPSSSHPRSRADYCADCSVKVVVGSDAPTYQPVLTIDRFGEDQ